MMGWLVRARRGLALIAFVAVAAQAADRSLESSVKATFLYKFASFVEWPAGSFASETSPFYLCVVGSDPYGGRIAHAVAGQSVGKHPIVLRHLPKADARSQCHEMFLSGTASQDVGEALRAVAGTPALTVTDSALAPEAGIVHFVIDDDRVSFDIDKVEAERSHLVISSSLLALAHRLTTAPRGDGR
jgi:hypothetical protein